MLGERLGVGIANAINTFDPDVVVVGGGVSVAGELLLGPARRSRGASSSPASASAPRSGWPATGARRAFAARRCSPGSELAGGDEGLAAPRREVERRERERPDGAGESLRPGRGEATPRRRRRWSSSAPGETWRRESSCRRSTTCGSPGLLPERFGVIGVSRAPTTCPRSEDGPRGDRRPTLAPGSTRTPGRRSSRKLEFLQGDFDDPELFEALAERLEATTPAGPTQRVFYLAVSPRFFAQIAKGAGGGRSGRRRRSADPADDREAVRARPRLGARAERRDVLRVRRVAGVPHRPLPRQGDGAEPPGAAVRERDPRADLEPPLRRPRPDHHGRGHRDRPPRRLLRLGRARFAT